MRTFTQSKESQILATLRSIDAHLAKIEERTPKTAQELQREEWESIQARIDFMKDMRAQAAKSGMSLDQYFENTLRGNDGKESGGL